MTKSAFKLHFHWEEKFSQYSQFSLDQRFDQSVERVKSFHVESRCDENARFPPIPNEGASRNEIETLEHTLGISLPGEYRHFLTRWRYLLIYDLFSIWGLNAQDENEPFIDRDETSGDSFLIFGQNPLQSDSDTLWMELHDERHRVWVSLHGKFVPFAPSFSLALCRMVEELLGGDRFDKLLAGVRLELESATKKRDRPWWKIW